MLKNNFYRPVVLRKVVHMLLDIFLNFVIFFAYCFAFCKIILLLQQDRHFQSFISATLITSIIVLWPFGPVPSFTPCSLFLTPCSLFLTPCSLFLTPCSFFLSFSPFFLPPPMHNAQSTKQRNCALALSKKSKSSWVTKHKSF